MNSDAPWQAQLDHVRRLALMAGGAGLGLCAVGVCLNPAQFFQAYLMAYMFWLGITLGCFAILMIHHVAGGRWGYAIRRLLEAAVATLPLLTLLFVPLLFGMHSLYSWTHPEVVAADANLQHKQPYLNVPFFVVRAALYFTVWLIVAFLLERAAAAQDRSPSRTTTRRLTVICGVGLGLYMVTMTFASIDWAMSLEPHWFSTMYGVLIMSGQVLGAFALVIIVAAWLSQFKPYTDAFDPAVFHDLGNFLLTFVIFWAYIAFSQFLIVWSGNLTDENPWYLERFGGGWRGVGIVLVVLHFFLPFFLLLSRNLKRRSPWLARVAFLLFVMGFVDVFWIIAPGFGRPGFTAHWMDVVAPIGVGGIWVSKFIKQLKARSALPIHDSRVEEALEWA